MACLKSCNIHTPRRKMQLIDTVNYFLMFHPATFCKENLTVLRDFLQRLPKCEHDLLSQVGLNNVKPNLAGTKELQLVGPRRLSPT